LCEKGLGEPRFFIVLAWTCAAPSDEELGVKVMGVLQGLEEAGARQGPRPWSFGCPASRLFVSERSGVHAFSGSRS